MKRVIAAFALTILGLSHTGGAQTAFSLRGTVRDSASGQPLPGVVVALRDVAAGSGRTISNDRGLYTLAVPSGAKAIQVLRIGFRARTLDLPPAASAAGFDITMTRLPTILEPVRSLSANRCKVRPDAAASFALLDQARAALLATVVARDANPATVTRLAFERVIDVAKDLPSSQKVRLESGVRATASFNSPRSAVELARLGFMRDSGSMQTYYGPDAEVLLDDRFVSEYCFSIAAREKARPRELGLAFAAASRKKGRIDIQGALWVDTVSRALKSIEFRYVGFDNNVMEGLGTGGRVSFAQAPNGVTLIDHWHLRLLGDADTAVYSAKGSPVMRRGFAVREVGGELARASWADGATWRGSLGTLRIAATERGKAAVGSIIALDSTGYRGVVDSTGVATIRDLLPGPYSVAVIDRTLAEIGVALPTSLAFTAARDSTVSMPLEVPSAVGYVASVCRIDGKASGESSLIGRVVTSDGQPAPQAKWKLSKVIDGSWQTISDGGVTGSTGLFHFCNGLAIGETVRVEAWRDGQSPDVSLRRITDSLTIVRASLKNALVARAVANAPGRLLQGVVVDSTTRTPVAGAHVSLVGTSLSGVSDSAGRFSIVNVPTGDYAAAVRTWTLDSLGAVVQSGFAFTDSTSSVTLLVPPASRVAASVCGVRDANAEGLIIGSVEMRGDTVPVSSVRVVADWTTSSTRRGVSGNVNHWAETVTDERGDFKLCGVPLNTALTVRAESDSAGAVPSEMRVAAGGAFARAELTLDRDIKRGAVFRGLVVTDSTLMPIPDAEVSFPGLARTVLTNDRGAFRFPEIPAGIQDVSVRRLSFGPINTKLQFFPNTTLDRRIFLHPAITLNAVETIASAVIPSFEENRRMGLGKFLDREQLAKYEGAQMSQALAQMQGANALLSLNGSHAYVMVNRRGAAKLPRCTMGLQEKMGDPSKIIQQNSTCSGGPVAASAQGTPSSSEKRDMATQEMRDLGLYCPSQAEQAMGMTCGCYAQVYVDNALMNPGKPTEPFDINTMPPSTIEALELYASPAQTPIRYQRMNSACGVVVIHTRRSQ
ncbi:MAG: carboxypeptidase regulatory-like domain-containing protein [Gemmatimonadota bacterium]